MYFWPFMEAGPHVTPFNVMPMPLQNESEVSDPENAINLKVFVMDMREFPHVVEIGEEFFMSHLQLMIAEGIKKTNCLELGDLQWKQALYHVKYGIDHLIPPDMQTFSLKYLGIKDGDHVIARIYNENDPRFAEIFVGVEPSPEEMPDEISLFCLNTLIWTQWQM